MPETSARSAVDGEKETEKFRQEATKRERKEEGISIKKKGQRRLHF
jgi:hypothetical protein